MVSDRWENVTLAQVGTFKKGSGISRTESNSGNLAAVRYGELYTLHNYYIRVYNSHISRTVAEKALRAIFSLLVQEKRRKKSQNVRQSLIT